MKIREIRGGFSGGDKKLLDFQVHDQTYFLGLSEDEEQWEVFVASPNGPRRIPLYVDAAPFDVTVVAKHRRHEVN